MLTGISGRAMSFVKSYSNHFILPTRDVSDKARQYARGLMQASAKKNMDRMAEVVPHAKSRNLGPLRHGRHFV